MHPPSVFSDINKTLSGMNVNHYVQESGTYFRRRKPLVLFQVGPELTSVRHVLRLVVLKELRQFDNGNGMRF